MTKRPDPPGVAHIRLSRIRRAIDDLRSARARLRQAGAIHAARYVARALKSAEGAERHALGRGLREVFVLREAFAQVREKQS